MLRNRLMLSFDEFKVSNFYRPRVLGQEDESQDSQDMRRMHVKDQQEQYARYVAQHEPKDVIATPEELRVKDNLNKITLHVKKVLRNMDKSRAEYMRNYRKKPKFCPHCKKQI